MPSPLVIFGCGYVGVHLARAALVDGQPVRACRRNTGALAHLSALGADLRAIDAAKHKQFGPALFGLASPSVVYAIPPSPGMPSGEGVRRAGQAALLAGARTFVYLGTAGIYGNRPDEDWVDEDRSIDLYDPSMAARHSDEMALQALASSGLRTVVLRLSAVYGPGRGIRGKLRSGEYKLSGDGNLWFSRIHVLDLVTVIRAAVADAPSSSIYLVGDDRPTRQIEYATWLAAHLGLPAPVPNSSPPAVVAHRARRIKNDKMKRDLKVTLAYPSFMEGELQIDEAEKAT